MDMKIDGDEYGATLGVPKELPSLTHIIDDDTQPWTVTPVTVARLTNLRDWLRQIVSG
jgi:hypothetical protein